MKSQETRKARQDAMLDIIDKQAVGSQEELMGLLKERGHSLTQATLSRDIKELGIIKAPVKGGYRYQAHSPKQIQRVKGRSISSADASGNFLVIKTGPGFAAAVASTIDNNVLCKAIMGTIAGDDTILVILRNAEGLKEAVAAISIEFPEINTLV